MNRIIVKQGDITQESVDVIVNAANKRLLGGGGVDGAIHHAAGKALLEECRKLNGCETGQAKITKGYQLPASHVIHTVGPVWRGGNNNERELLAGCYQSSLVLASQHQLSRIAFPCISTGLYHFPKKDAAAIAVGAVKKYLKDHLEIDQVVFVCFSAEDEEHYRDLLE